ncbi:MAG: hypothetical protein EHM91_02540 [Planctomycetota bacterium]|nr:MAG: hypothetical protein EHM91_02540 [Planctomycetota bacterium]
MKNLALLILMAAPLVGCTATRLDADHDAHFSHIFGERPADLKVLNSRVYCMWWTSDDWEFELYAPASWVESQKWGLRRIQEKTVWDDEVMFPGEFWRPRYASPWFAPGEPQLYEVWQLCLTSIPYKHLYVEKASKENNLIHVYYRRD